MQDMKSLPEIIYSLFCDGFDTVDIAGMLDCSEADIYNTLSLRSYGKRKAA